MYICQTPVELDIDYAKKFGITQTQQKLKRIISKIDSICRKNDINYSIAYGTQIGAVRHGGFIPWDDDLDIIMLRDDFNKFREQITETTDSDIKLVYNLWIERVILNNDDDNVFIDIMILDNFPDNSFVASIKSLLCRTLQGTLKENIDWYNYHFFHRMLLFVTSLIGKALGKKKCLSIYHKIQLLGNSKDTQHIASYNSGYRDTSEPFKKVWFDKYIDIKFDELTLKSNSAFHELLTSYYGDYMVLPPEENRIPEHGRGN